MPNNNNNERSFLEIKSIRCIAKHTYYNDLTIVKLEFSLNDDEGPHVKNTRFSLLHKLLDYCPIKNKFSLFVNKVCGTRPEELSRGYKGQRWTTDWLKILKDYLNTKIEGTDGFITEFKEYLKKNR